MIITSLPYTFFFKDTHLIYFTDIYSTSSGRTGWFNGIIDFFFKSLEQAFLISKSTDKYNVGHYDRRWVTYHMHLHQDHPSNTLELYGKQYILDLCTYWLQLYCWPWRISQQSKPFSWKKSITRFAQVSEKIEFTLLKHLRGNSSIVRPSPNAGNQVRPLTLLRARANFLHVLRLSPLL